MKNRFRIKNILILAIIAIILIISDQVTKYIITQKFYLGESINIIDNFLSFTYIHNAGAAFGIMQGKQLFFVITSIIILPLIIFFYLKISDIIKEYGDRVSIGKLNVLKVSLLLIFSGAVGNFIDRVRLSYVIDFIEVKFIEFPVFNVADCYVTIGAGLVFLIVLLLKEKELDLITKSRKKWIDIDV